MPTDKRLNQELHSWPLHTDATRVLGVFASYVVLFKNRIEIDFTQIDGKRTATEQ